MVKDINELVADDSIRQRLIVPVFDKILNRKSGNKHWESIHMSNEMLSLRFYLKEETTGAETQPF